jgi:hypothetical protein
MLFDAMTVFEKVLQTLSLLFITSAKAVLSWVDWSVSIVGDVIGRVYAHPNGFLVNVLLLICVGVCLGIVAVTCVLGSYLWHVLLPASSTLADRLFGWGTFLLRVINPFSWITTGFGAQRNAAPAAAPQQAVPVPGAEAFPVLSDKVDALTGLVTDRLEAIEAGRKGRWLWRLT